MVHVAGDERVDPGTLPADPPRIVGAVDGVGGWPPDTRINGVPGHQLSDSGDLEVVSDIRQPLRAVETFGQIRHVIHVVDGQNVRDVIVGQAVVILAGEERILDVLVTAGGGQCFGESVYRAHSQALAESALQRHLHQLGRQFLSVRCEFGDRGAATRPGLRHRNQLALLERHQAAADGGLVLVDHLRLSRLLCPRHLAITLGRSGESNASRSSHRSRTCPRFPGVCSPGEAIPG